MLRVLVEVVQQAAEGGRNDLVVWTTALSTIGIVLVAAITGIFNWLQSRAVNRAKTAAETSAMDAEAYAAALAAKTATVDALKEQVETLEHAREEDRAEIKELRGLVEECHENDRAHSLLERDWTRRIEELEAHFGRGQDPGANRILGADGASGSGAASDEG